MTEPSMPKAYNPHEWEEALYEWWETQGYFHPEQQIASGLADPSRRPFVISMPPPNVTGALHLGHAIMSSIEDMLTRYYRMQGVRTLWLPGTDHAGIATQNVVERELEKQGITRQDLGREAFIAEVWSWKDEYHGRITRQQKRLGISADWARERFTLDDGLSAAVLEAFVRLYDEGLIYRGNYLVNWCPRCQSAISDLEVDYEEVTGRFYTFRYPLQEGGFLEVSTTRPETILGDTAVAVHPDDERYRDVVGKTALVPMLNRPIPVIADAYVDPEFGTGRAQGDAGARSQRLRDRQAPRAAHAQHPERRRLAQRQSRALRRAGPLRRAQEALGRHEGGGPGGGRPRARASSGPLPALRHHRGAAAQRAVVGQDGAAGQARPGGREQRRHHHRARALRTRLQPLAGKHPRLVHQPPALVGPPHPRVVRARRRRVRRPHRSGGAPSARPPITADR